MTPLERLLLEAIPVRPAPALHSRRTPDTHSQWTPEEQEWHWQELADGLGIPSEPRPHHPPVAEAAA